MRSLKCRKVLFLSSALAGVMYLGGTAFAQQQQQGGVETVVVTAEKRVENVKDVPISIAVVSAEDLQQQGIHNLDELLGNVPGLTIEHSSGQERLAIDGIANSFGDTSLVGVYLDEASITGTQTNQLNVATVDLDRVEVLRGPQGTLYGQGSLGGTIRYVTKEPDLENYGFNADVGVETTQGGAPSAYVNPVVNIPLIDGELGLRVAGAINYQGGWVSDPTNNLNDVNYTDRKDVRAKLLWKPNDQAKVELMVMTHRSYGTNDTGIHDDSTFVPIAPLNGPTYLQDNYDLYNLNASYDFGFATLHNSTTYYNYSFDQSVEETNPLTAPPSPPLTVVLSPWPQAVHDLNEELRLTSNPGSPVVWDVGYFFERTTSFSNFAGFYEDGALALFNYFTNVETNSNAVFGNVSYKFFDRLTLAAGVRYYEDVRHNTNGFDNLTIYNGIEEKADHTLDPRFDVTLAVTDDVNLYGSVAKGFRSGGFNGSAGLPGVELPSFRPEEDWRYEVGMKGNFLDNHLSANVSAFYTAYSNYIVLGFFPTPVGVMDTFANGGDAKIEGVEGDLTWAPSDEWLVTFSGAYIHSEFTKVTPFTEHFVGDPVDNISPLQTTFQVQRNFTWRGKPAYFLANFKTQAPEHYENRWAATDPVTLGPAESLWYVGKSNQINLVNVRGQIQWNENLSLALYGNNLTNDKGALNAFTPEDVVDYERPRTFGMEAIVNF